MSAQGSTAANSPVHVTSDIVRPQGDSRSIHELDFGSPEKKPIQDEPMWDGHSPRKPMVKRRKSAKMEDSLLGALCTWIVEHQIGIAMNLLLLLGLTHICFPRARRHTRKFFDLSYHNEATGRYALGWDDIFMVFHWIVVFTGLRVAVMEYILLPLAEYAGIGKKKERIRFAEQAWIFLYASAFWSLGMYIMYNSDYWLGLHSLWTNWPDREMNGLFKWYYLVQFAFWLQQILVVNIEERRKDYAQMFTHHIITSTLMLTSYGYHFTKVGNVILCLMDAVDIVLPLAKLLKYLKYQLACDIAFGVFMIVWFISRHALYMIVCYSIWVHVPGIIPHGCFWGSNQNLQGPIDFPHDLDHLTQPFRDSEGLVCFDNSIRLTFLGMLLALQAILLIWFGMIMRVAWKVIQGGEAEDSRSDDEDEEEVEETRPQRKAFPSQPCIGSPPLEEEVGVEAINLNSRKSSPGQRYKKGGGTTSGVTLHSDRKELLGRIGCDKSA